MKLCNVKDNTYYIETKFSCIPIYKLNDKEIIMLDTGFFSSDTSGIKDILRKNDFIVKAIICTHAHIDHIGNNSWIKEEFGCEIIMHEYEAMTCESLYNLKAYGMRFVDKKSQHKYVNMVCETDRKLKSDDIYVDVCGHRFEIIKLYGHTYYHIGIITPDKVFYVGDALLTSDVLKDTKVAYVKDFSMDIETKYKIKDIVCDKYILAHKGVVDDIKPIIDENIQFLENQLNAILDVIIKPMTMDEIMKELFIKFEVQKRVEKYSLAQMMLSYSIDYLLDNSLIKVETIDGYLKYSRNKYVAI